jgi:hypothetical protein
MGLQKKKVTDPKNKQYFILVNTGLHFTVSVV